MLNIKWYSKARAVMLAVILATFIAWPAQSFEQGTVLGVHFTPSDACEKEIIQRISNASRIEIAVYSINNENIIKAVIAAHKNGAKVQVVTDRTQAKGKWSLVPSIQDAGIPLRTNRRHKIEHNKFAVFDDNVVVTGSFNWTNPASTKNSENCIFITDPQKKFQERFYYLWDYYEPKAE